MDVPNYQIININNILHTSSYCIIIFLYHFYQAAVAIKICNLLICFCSFDLSCPTLEKDSYIEKVLSCLVALFFKSCLFQSTNITAKNNNKIVCVVIKLLSGGKKTFLKCMFS